LDSGSLGYSDLRPHQLDSGSLGCSDLQSRFSSLGFSEAAKPSVGKMGTSSCPSLFTHTKKGVKLEKNDLLDRLSLT
ncbi:hypothetical protein Tco_1196014, partial [Tanacetum coccineum]